MGVGQDKTILMDASRTLNSCAGDAAESAEGLRELERRVEEAWVSPAADLCAERLRTLARRMDAVSEGLRQGAAKIGAAALELDETGARNTKRQV